MCHALGGCPTSDRSAAHTSTADTLGELRRHLPSRFVEACDVTDKAELCQYGRTLTMDVSVVIPTRNRSALLTKTLRSALRQQDVAHEVIVVDEASTDDTLALLAGVADGRVRVIHHAVPWGLSGARNHGADEARGEWLAFLDDDDLWAPDKLIQQLRAAREARRDWVYTGAVNIDGRRIVHSRPPPPPEEVVATLPRWNAIPGGGSNVLVRRTAWLDAGPFDTRFRRGGEDWEMWIRLAKHGPPAWVRSPLIAKRVHSSNMFLDVGEIIRATKLIETLHATEADWGRMHRWLADRYLRSGRRRAALGQFARAAVRGQLRDVAFDLGVIIRRRVGYSIGSAANQSGFSDGAWTEAAAAWLGEFEGCLAS